MKTNVTRIDTGIRRRKAILESKLSELLKLTGSREELEIQPTADPLDQVRSSTDRDMAVEALNQQARSIHEIRSRWSGSRMAATASVNAAKSRSRRSVWMPCLGRACA